MSNLFGVELKSMRYDYTSPKTLYVHTIVIAGTSTKVLLTSFFHRLPFCLWILLWRFWACTQCSLQAQKYITLGPKHVWASSIFFERRWMEPKGSQGKERSKQSFCTTCNNTYLYAHILLRVMEVLMKILSNLSYWTFQAGK